MKKFKLDFTTINKVLIVVLMIVALFMSTFYKPLGNEVLDSLGEYEDSIYYMDGVWMDFTEYGKINYSLVNTRENEYFVKISEYDLVKLNYFIDRFEGLIENYKEYDLKHNEGELREVVANYDFDRSIIDDKDYVYIETDERVEEFEGNEYIVYEMYEVYLLDSQTNVVYYFYNKI